MFKVAIVGCIVAVVSANREEELLPERKNVLGLSDAKRVNRRLLSKSSSSGSSSSYSDDGVCGCTAYLDDSSSSSWSNGKKTSTSSSSKTRRRLGSSSSKWATDTTGTTQAPFDSFCDCLCACDGGNTVTYNQGGDRRRLGSSSKWGCGSGSSSGSSGKKSSSSSSGTSATTSSGSSSSGKSTSSSSSGRRRLGSSSKWSTGTEAPCSTEPFSTTTLTCQCGTTQQPSSSPTDKPTTSPSDKPTASPSSKPTESPTDRPTLSPTTEEPTNSPSDRPTDSPSDRPTSSPVDAGCPDNSDYIILGFGWEMYLASIDKSVYLSGRYNQNGAQFEHETRNLTIWWEAVGSDYVLVIGNQDDVRLQLYYKDLVSTWSDDDNPLIDSDDESEWEPGDETLEYVTSNMTVYDCNGDNRGTDVYTQYAYVSMPTNASSREQVQVGILAMFSMIAIVATILG